MTLCGRGATSSACPGNEASGSFRFLRKLHPSQSLLRPHCSISHIVAGGPKPCRPATPILPTPWVPSLFGSQCRLTRTAIPSPGAVVPANGTSAPKNAKIGTVVPLFGTSAPLRRQRGWKYHNIFTKKGRASALPEAFGRIIAYITFPFSN